MVISVLAVVSSEGQHSMRDGEANAVNYCGWVPGREQGVLAVLTLSSHLSVVRDSCSHADLGFMDTPVSSGRRSGLGPGH